MAIRKFGTLPDGTRIQEIDIQADGISASIISWGAVIQKLVLDGSHSVVLGFNCLEHYLAHSPYFGALVGRCANRIAHGRFDLDGVTYQLSLNEGGRTHLHGGLQGFAHQAWQIDEMATDMVSLRLRSPDGAEGYPGQVEVTCRYQLADRRLVITLEGRTDRPTILNLAGHSYFNLEGTGDTLGHLLEIPASYYTPADERLIPTGEIATVENTPLDFRKERPVLHSTASGRFAYDHNFVIGRAPSAEPRLAARLTGPATGICLEVWSTEPGLQFYDAGKLNVPVPGLNGEIYGPNAGLCLEAQRFPDAINQPNFGNVILRPGETYRQVTEYRFFQA
ncbi:aldose epimerase family protein [Dongia soli]|uniref:Aldose 1-epimerase n=1 Tax=Dongia soli TaxID=600628 RepID=A0ABU5EA11_9PROT|nr:aldose epimerase family protein [Dongia soli]MDY0882742.1 aldose epimerase family protein [Dongia soli]